MTKKLKTDGESQSLIYPVSVHWPNAVGDLEEATLIDCLPEKWAEDIASLIRDTAGLPTATTCRAVTVTEE